MNDGKSVVKLIMGFIGDRAEKGQLGYKKLLEYPKLEELIECIIRENYKELKDIEILDNHREDIIAIALDKVN